MADVRRFCEYDERRKVVTISVVSQDTKTPEEFAKMYNSIKNEQSRAKDTIKILDVQIAEMEKGIPENMTIDKGNLKNFEVFERLVQARKEKENMEDAVKEGNEHLAIMKKTMDRIVPILKKDGV